MESSGSERSLDPSERPAPPADRPAVSGGKVERLAQHTQYLVQDLKQWIDLRIELAQLELEERIESQVNRVLLGLIVAVLAALGGFFGLVALALGFGAALGHPAWGFLIVTVLLAVIAAVLRAAEPEFVQIDLRAPPDASDDPDKEAP